MTHFVARTNTDEQEKDLWQTPSELFRTLDKEFLFEVDICANDKNALCAKYFTAQDSALDYNWYFTSVFMNPPYSETEKFLTYAANQAKDHNVTVVALVNANTDTKWFSNAEKTANEIRLITGRLSFEKPSGGKVNGNTKGQCLIIWRGKCSTPCQITLIDRNDLTGNNLNNPAESGK